MMTSPASRSRAPGSSLRLAGVAHGSKCLGAAAALHGLVLLAGALSIARERASEPVAQKEGATRERLVDVAQLSPGMDEDRSSKQPSGGAATRVDRRDSPRSGGRRESAKRAGDGAPH